MAEVMVFHHAHGLTAGVREFAERLGADGHVVHVPDLFDGQVFDDLAAGVRHAQTIGFDTLVQRGRAAAEGLPGALVYAGFSLGALPAQALAQSRPGAAGALLLHACLPLEGDWPAGVPVQVHAMEDDPFFVQDGDLDAARQLVAATDDAELFLYPGAGHLFADRALPAYDPSAARLLQERVLAFLRTVG